MNLPFLWSAPADGGCVSISSDSSQLATERPVYYGLEGNHHLQQPYVFERVFSPQECERIRLIGSALPLWTGMSTSEDENYRVCKTAWIEENGASDFIFRRLREVVQSVNELYQLDAAGFGEPLHFIAYEPGGHFEWHTDLGSGPMSTRKISLSIQLSDEDAYAGGDLEFCPHGVIEEFRGIGNAIAFPSYIAHRVLPVSTGHRHALVAWIHGPSFK